MCMGAQSNLKNTKSGNYVKSSANIVRQEVWPHTVVSKKYAKRTGFDNMEFNAFVARESKIIHTMLGNGDFNATTGRLRVLTLVSHWLCRVKNWTVIRNMFESIIEEVETDDREWSDDFSSHETMLPALVSQGDGMASLHSGNRRKLQDIYWCKPYQSSQCEQPSPHMAQLKQKEAPILVLHICAHCWAQFWKRKEHQESECPSQK